MYTVSPKMSLLCLAITPTYTNRVTEKVGNQKIVYFSSALPGEMKKDKHSILSLNAVLFHCQTSTSRWLYLVSLCLQLMLMLLYDSLNLSVSGVKLWTKVGP